MPHATAPQAPPRATGRSISFQGRDALAQLPDFASELLDFLAQFGHGPDGIGELGGGAVGAGGQEDAFPLVAHHETIGLELVDGGAGHGHRDPVALLEIPVRGELSCVGELAIRDASPQVIGYLLIGELAGPLDHLHPKSRLCLCLIVPKPQT